MRCPVENEFLQDPTLIQEFLVESEELLQRMDQDMVTLETTPKDAESLNRIFRALHTIKGTSGFWASSQSYASAIAPRMFSTNERKGELQLSQRMMDALLRARDQLGQMLSDIRQGGLRNTRSTPWWRNWKRFASRTELAKSQTPG